MSNGNIYTVNPNFLSVLGTIDDSSKKLIVAELKDKRNRLIWALRLQLGLEPINLRISRLRARLEELHAEFREQYPNPEQSIPYNDETMVAIRGSNQLLRSLNQNLENQLRSIFPDSKVPTVQENRKSLFKIDRLLMQIRL